MIMAVGAGGSALPALACFTPEPSKAEWYFPNMSVVPLGILYTDDNAIISVRQSTAITLHRGVDATSPSGLYCCGSPSLPIDQRLCINLREFSTRACR